LIPGEAGGHEPGFPGARRGQYYSLAPTLEEDVDGDDDAAFWRMKFPAWTSCMRVTVAVC